MVPALLRFLDRIPSLVLVAIGFVAALGLVAVVALERRRRRRAEGAAGTALGQLRTVTASMREGVIAYDMDLRLTFVNPAFERLTGYVAEDLRDQEFLQYVHPDDRPALLAEWERLTQGGALRDQEYRLVTRGGQVRWCASAWEPLRDERGRQIGYLGTEFDITERKLAEEEMRLDTELFQAVIEVQQAVAAAVPSAAPMSPPRSRSALASRSVKAFGWGETTLSTPMVRCSSLSGATSSDRMPSSR